MIEPERWYEYQKNYQKYGLDMKPKPEPETREDRQRKRRQAKSTSSDSRKAAFAAVLIIGCAMIIMIITTAYCASLRYSNNSLIKENQAMTGEIEELQAEVYSANNIEYIESKATDELGMVYASDGKTVYVAGEDIPEEGFADILKEKAYN